MPQEPGSFKSNPQGPVKLIGAATFFRRANQGYGLEPNTQGKVAIFKDSPHLDGERLLAGIALVHTDPGAFAVHLTDPLLAPAVGADRSFGPHLGFDISVSS